MAEDPIETDVYPMEAQPTIPVQDATETEPLDEELVALENEREKHRQRYGPQTEEKSGPLYPCA